METHASHVIQDQALILLVLLWGRCFPTKPFPPWLIGSDQCEHFFSKCRAMRINQPDWKFADLLRIVQRFITPIKLSSDDDVHLPEVFSNKGYSGSKYTPSTDGEHVHTDWPTAAEVRSEYAAAVERLRPVFVLMGCAEALQRAGRWQGPSLEEWESIERALDLEEEEQAEAAALRRRRRRPAAEAGSDSEEEDEDGGGGGEIPELEGADADGDAGDDYFPEEIMDHRVGKGGPRLMVEGRELLIKWRGYSRSKDDLTWEKQSELIADGNGLLVHRYLQAHTSLKRPEALDAAVQAELAELGEAGGEAGEVGGNDGGDGAGSSAPPQRQPDVEPADRAAVLAMLTAPIGSEVPNLRSAKVLKPDASTKQRQAYQAMHVTNPCTNQVVHKQIQPLQPIRPHSPPSPSESRCLRTMAACSRRRSHALVPLTGSLRSASSCFNSGTFISISAAETTSILSLAKSSSRSVAARSRGPPAATVARAIEKLPACAPAPAVATALRPRLSTGTSTGRARAQSATQRPPCFSRGRTTALQCDASVARTVSRNTRDLPLSFRSSITSAYPTPSAPSSTSSEVLLSARPA
eukprot:scaffold84121_cov105-Phaeocystis_antarctica.AAC.4